MSDDESILAEAERLVNGDRQAQYGHPSQDFARTGRIWGAILGIPDVPPHLVALCLIGVKQSRIVNDPSKRDSWVDLAGYSKAGYISMEPQPENVEQPEFPWCLAVERRDDTDLICGLPQGHTGPHAWALVDG